MDKRPLEKVIMLNDTIESLRIVRTINDGMVVLKSIQTIDSSASRDSKAVDGLVQSLSFEIKWLQRLDEVRVSFECLQDGLR